MRYLTIIILCLGISLSQAVAGSDKLDLDFTLPAPTEKIHQTYLGVDPGQPFTLDQVKADILVIEIFSMYCPICQREAPQVNTLFQRLEKVKDQSVRLIGIGAGNSSFETEFFKKTYGIEFPLFSDDKFVIHKKIGEKGTPFFIGLKPGAPKADRVFFTHSGDIKDLDAFVAKLLGAGK